jgi:hypothetical protein
MTHLRAVKTILVLALLVMPQLVLSDDSLQALKNRYDNLKSNYLQLKKQGVDVASISPLVEEIERTRKNKDFDELGRLLGQLESRISSLPSPPVKNLKQQTFDELAGLEEISILKKLFLDREFIALLDARSGVVSVSDSGAVGRNQEKFSDVAAQRDVIWLLLHGLAKRDALLIEKCVKAMEFGFSFRTEQGYFRNGLGESPRRAITADAFFLQVFGHVYLLLQQDETGRSFLPRLQKLAPDLRRALNWLRDNRDALFSQDRKAPNRLAFDGLAFLLNGTLLNDTALQKIGCEFLAANLETQRSDGVFVEHGGHDSSYQAVNALVLQVAWFYIKEPQLKERVLKAVGKGLEWEESRVLDNGRIMVEGNTRTGLGQEKLFGKIKDVNYPEVATAFYYWSQLGGSSRARSCAASITNFALAAR